MNDKKYIFSTVEKMQNMKIHQQIILRGDINVYILASCLLFLPLTEIFEKNRYNGQRDNCDVSA